MINQICIASLIQGLSEALHFAKRENLDISAVMGAISQGAAQSWQMENRWQTMIDDEFDFGFAVEWMRKDLEIAIDEAERVNANLDWHSLFQLRQSQFLNLFASIQQQNQSQTRHQS